MTIEDIKRFIKDIELFAGLNDNELQSVATKVKEIEVKKGEMVFSEGDARTHFYIVYDGIIELYMNVDENTEKVFTIFEKNDFFGEGSLLEDAKHSTNARARKNAVLLEFEKSIISSSGELAVKIFSNISRVISRRMRRTNSNNLVNSAAQYVSGKTRTEHDLLGNKEVPEEAYYGVQTLRAMENFHISGVSLNFFPDLIVGLAMVKKGAAKANYDLGLLTEELKDAIVKACDEVINGKFHYHFTVDMIQGGAGTSTNMNINEVIANRALEHMGYEKGQYQYCHPNNHINLSQSTNDAYPTAVKLAFIRKNKQLVGVLEQLIASFKNKAKEFAHVLKMGRTQLQDAVPMTLGQTFEAYAATLEEEIERLNQNSDLFLEINMGATAIGTGINSEPEYSKLVTQHLRDVTGFDLVLAKNLVEATSDTGSFVMYSSAIKRMAIKLSKICDDLRLLSSGPRTGLNEINLPPMQPGSTIMPGKVNPVIPEVVNQIAFKVIGNDLTVSFAAQAGQLELNVMEPVIVKSIFESTQMLTNGMEALRTRCIDGITANEDVCRAHVENSIGLVTALNPFLGYETCTALAKEALETGQSVYQLVLDKKLLSVEELEDILKPENMIKPRKMK